MPKKKKRKKKGSREPAVESAASGAEVNVVELAAENAAALTESATDFRPDDARDVPAKNLRLIALLSNVWRTDIRWMARVRLDENTEGWAMWQGPPVSSDD